MDFPFIGGRIKPDEVTRNLTRNLKLELKTNETSSTKKAWIEVKNKIDSGIPVGLKLDCYHLDYFTSKIHFAAHYVAMYGYDDDFAYLIDTHQQGGKVKTRLKNLELARNEKGPMSSKNLSYIITNRNEAVSLKDVIITAIKNNAEDYLNPPIKNIGYKGIEKTSKVISKWFERSRDIKKDLTLVALLMEKAGTGGALFRNLYRDFLKESSEIYPNEHIENGYKKFCDIALKWSEVSSLINEAGETVNKKYLLKASDILKELSVTEKEAMLELKEI